MLQDAEQLLKRLRQEARLSPEQQALLDGVLEELTAARAAPSSIPYPRERELQAMLENAPDMIARLDRNLCYLYVNPVIEKMTGLPFQAFLGKSNRDLKIPEDICTLWEQRADEVFETGAETQFRFSAPTLEGERYYDVRLVPELADEGTVESILAIVRDISEGEQMRQARRRYARRLRFLHQVSAAIREADSAEEVAEAVLPYAQQLLSSARASVALYDREANEAFLLAVRSNEETTLGKGERLPLVWDRFMEELSRGRIVKIDDLSAMDSPGGVVQSLSAEGVHSLISVPLIIQDELIGSLNLSLAAPRALTAEDEETAQEVADQLAITVHQALLYEEVQRHSDVLQKSVARRTAALHLSQARFRTIFENAAIGIALMDTGGRIETSNPALQKMLGYSAEELRGMNVAQFIHPDDLEARQVLLNELLTGQRDHFQMERRYIRKDGTTIWVRPTVSLVRTPQGTARYSIKMVEDISEEKKAREALIQAERLALAGQLGASLAHEINNPLQSTIGSLGLVQEMLDSSDEAQLFLQIAAEELERAAGIVNQLRDLNRRSEPGNRQPTQLNEIAEKVLLLTKKKCETQQIVVDWKPAADLPEATVAADRVRQVFLNLVMNAIESMPSGGRLQVGTARTRQPDGVQVTFVDNGTGIDPDVLPYLFEPFHSTRPEGLGLGLYISKTIVEEHGGRIKVDSRAGAGTTFEVWLPLQL